MKDEELVSRSLKGDRSAFEELVRRYYDLMRYDYEGHDEIGHNRDYVDCSGGSKRMDNPSSETGET